MSTRRIRPGPRMSQAVVHNGIVTTAGQVALKAAGEDAITQTKTILDSIDELLAEAGTNKSNLLTATIWLSDIALFDQMNEVWDAWIDKEAPPTRACVESKLASPKFVVEIAVTASV